MPINSRNKGAKFERDIAKILNGFFRENGIEYETKRNLDQYQQKDLCDLNIPGSYIQIQSKTCARVYTSICNQPRLAKRKR